MSIIIKAENISYSINQKEILKNISFELERGLILGISGESGSGKTTLAKIIAGIIEPTGGKLTFNFLKEDKNLKSNRVQLLFQNTGEIINPLRKVGSMLNDAVDIYNKSFTGSDWKIKAEDIFLKVFPSGKNKEEAKGYELSGGEQQRVALARILAVHPEILILDEPFSAQDFESQRNLLNLFLELINSFDLTMICISHNLGLLKKLSDEIMIIYDGEIVETNKSKELFENPQHPYTKFLLKAEKYNLNFEDVNISGG
jgi:ABC-type dipeptide/oligopeptide/nickel transport system ATPase subunit